MTNIQRAFCVVLSLIFLGVVAVLPGDFFRHGEIYRQLPLYCFLEKESSAEGKWQRPGNRDAFAGKKTQSIWVKKWKQRTEKSRRRC